MHEEEYHIGTCIINVETVRKSFQSPVFKCFRTDTDPYQELILSRVKFLGELSLHWPLWPSSLLYKAIELLLATEAQSIENSVKYSGTSSASPQKRCLYAGLFPEPWFVSVADYGLVADLFKVSHFLY